MSSKERRAANEAAYEEECKRRREREAYHKARFGDLEERLENAGFDLCDLKAWVFDLVKNGAV
jgi:hypothetical protein